MHSSNLVSKDAAYKASAEAVRDELSGSYIYQPAVPVAKPEPKVEPPAAPEQDDLENVLAKKKKQLEQDLERYSQINQFIGPDARKFLDGGFR